jgi:hypothetical protein
MKIERYLNNLLFDISNFTPDTLSSIVSVVREHEDYGTIIMLSRNSKRSTNCVINKCFELMSGNDSLIDVRLAGLLVIMADSKIDQDPEWVSSFSELMDKYKWSRAMAASYLIHKEMLDEKLCKST